MVNFDNVVMFDVGRDKISPVYPALNTLHKFGLLDGSFPTLPDNRVALTMAGLSNIAIDKAFGN